MFIVVELLCFVMFVAVRSVILDFALKSDLWKVRTPCLESLLPECDFSERRLEIQPVTSIHKTKGAGLPL